MENKETTILKRRFALPKAVKISLIVLAGLIVVYLGYYFYAVHFSLDYCNSYAPVSSASAQANGYELGTDFNNFLDENGYKIEAPFFGNKMILPISGASYMVPSFVDSISLGKLYNSYDAINIPLNDYVFNLSKKCNALGKVGYTVEKSDGLLTVHFSGELYNADGSVLETVDDDFVFEVKGASMFKSPVQVG